MPLFFNDSLIAFMPKAPAPFGPEHAASFKDFIPISPSNMAHKVKATALNGTFDHIASAAAYPAHRGFINRRQMLQNPFYVYGVMRRSCAFAAPSVGVTWFDIKAAFPSACRVWIWLVFVAWLPDCDLAAGARVAGVAPHRCPSASTARTSIRIHCNFTWLVHVSWLEATSCVFAHSSRAYLSNEGHQSDAYVAMMISVMCHLRVAFSQCSSSAFRHLHILAHRHGITTAIWCRRAHPQDPDICHVGTRTSVHRDRATSAVSPGLGSSCRRACRPR